VTDSCYWLNGLKSIFSRIFENACYMVKKIQNWVFEKKQIMEISSITNITEDCFLNLESPILI